MIQEADKLATVLDSRYKKRNHSPGKVIHAPGSSEYDAKELLLDPSYNLRKQGGHGRNDRLWSAALSSNPSEFMRKR